MAEYRSNLEDEIRTTCERCLSTLETLLTGGGVSDESGMFYRQMQGDAMRYQLEVMSEPAAKAELISDALAAYTQATEGVAAAGLAATNPVRLSLALNFAVFHRTALGEPEEAVRIASEALEAAVSSMDAMEESTFEATTRSMRQLSDALRSWGAGQTRQAPAEMPSAPSGEDRARRREYGQRSSEEEEDFGSRSASDEDDAESPVGQSRPVSPGR